MTYLFIGWVLFIAGVVIFFERKDYKRHDRIYGERGAK